MACLSGCVMSLSDLSSASSSLYMGSDNLRRMKGVGGGVSSVAVESVGRRRKGTMKVQGTMGLQGKFKGTQMREKQLTEMIEKKVMEATEVCQGDPVADECKVAWDEVEEVSQAKADLRLKLEKNKDPLESFCEENPETDECRIYED